MFMSDFIFSIVMAIYNSENYLEEAIESVINQTFDFEKVQLILVDDGSIDNSKEIALKYQSKYPNNIIVLSKENGGPGSARNFGLKHVLGKFVNFLDSDDALSPETLANIYTFFSSCEDEVDLVAIPMVYFERMKKNDVLRYKYEKTQIIDLIKDYDYPQLSISSTFIKSELFDKFTFSEDLACSEDTLLVNQILLEKKKIAFFNNATYYFRKRENKTSQMDIYRDKKEFFIPRLKLFFKKLIDYSIEKEGHVPNFIQSLLVYNLKAIVNTKDIHAILDEEEYSIFYESLFDVLSYLNQDLVYNINSIDGHSRNYLLYIMNGCKTEIVKANDDISLVSGGFTLNKLSESNIYIDIIEMKDGFINISGYLYNYYKDGLSVIAVKENNQVVGKDSKKYSSLDDIKNDNDFEIYSCKPIKYEVRGPRSFLSNPFLYYYNFDLSVPINLKNFKINLKVTFEDKDDIILIDSPIFFRRDASLSTSSHYTFDKENILLYTNNSLYLMPYGLVKHLKYELRGIIKILKDRGPYYYPSIVFRLGYTFLYLLFLRNKEIWLFMDRKELADDNAEHLFKYSLSQDDGIKKYFTLREDSPDFERLKNIFGDLIVPFGSIKHRFIYLFTSKIISSQATGFYFNPFTYKNPNLCSGLFTAKIYFLQHGIIQQDLSSWLTKFDKNVSLIVTSADLERESIVNNKCYNYDESIVKTFGLPRYDNLNNKNLKRQIVIMPTWRTFITNETELVESEYFKRFNGLMNNEKLIDYANEKGYKILFKPHPNVYPYIHRFETDKIEVDFEKKYQEIFNESALMITDFSTVAFDFAYLNKPIIYYQYAKEHRFDLDSGYFKYETMGFGEVISEEDQLVDRIIRYIENDCKMEEAYVKRVKEFFRYNDRNNCKRSYDWIIEH